MAELLRGETAPTVAEAGPSAPPRAFRIRDSGRLAPDAAKWARPLSPPLWQRLEDERRQAHERAVEAYAEAAKARELAVKARQAAVDDEAALRKAVASGSKVPKPRAPAVEDAAAEAKRAAEAAGRLALESGAALAEPLSDDDVKAAIVAPLEQAAEIISTIPELVDRMQERLAEAARLGG
jgi:translation initiation factor IF-2